jgi:hypothetical protein
VGQYGEDNGLFMGCEGGEVQEEEAEVIDWASKDSGGCEGQKLPSICYPGALSEKVEDRFRGRTTSEASWRGREAEAVASDLEGEDVVEGTEGGVNQSRRETGGSEAAPDAVPTEAGHFGLDFWWRRGGHEVNVDGF